MAMRHFLELSDNDPALAYSPMVRALGSTFAYIPEKGPIGLTPSGAFKRVFVEWAAERPSIGRAIDRGISMPSTRF